MKYWFHILKSSNSLGIIIFLTFFITLMGLLSPIFIIHIFNRYIAFGLQGTLFFLVTGALSVALFEYIFRNIRNNIFSQILVEPIKRFKLDIIKKFFEKEIKVNNVNFIDVIDFNNNFYQFLSPKIQSNIFDAFFASLIIFILFFLDLLLATFFLILVIIFLILQQKLISKKNNFIINSKLNYSDRLILRELGSNQELLKSTFALKFSGYNLENYFDKKLNIDSSLAKYDAKQISTISFFILLSSIFTIGIGSVLVVNGNLSIGSLIGFNIFATRALGTISSVHNSLSILGKLKIYLKDCSEFFKDSRNRADGMQLSKLLGNIKISNLNFSYSKEDRQVIKNLSVEFNASEINVVSGANASGKSTLAKLIVGLLNQDSGEILVDNTNLNKLSLVWLKNHVVYIAQNPSIVNSSILDNILLSNPELNEQEVSRLLQNVGLDDELKKSNLTISETINSNFSKGILKKIHIARSICRNYNIYIFDDPTLYLDKNGRAMIIKLIISLKRAGKTIICFSEDDEIIKLGDKKVRIK
ncbi:MAG: ATP-binding cassette domain-containing protein [Alphaproteobacteria bacterium]